MIRNELKFLLDEVKYTELCMFAGISIHDMDISELKAVIVYLGNELSRHNSFVGGIVEDEWQTI